MTDWNDEGLTRSEQLENIGIKDGSDGDDVGKAHFLDNNETVQRHFRQALQWWNYERAKQMDSRAIRMLCHDYVDGDQYTEEEKYELENIRGQMATVFNLIKSTHDWLVGTERQMRYSFNVLPAIDDPTAAKSAESKTKLLEYLQAVNKARYARSQRFKDQVISGLGWMDLGLRGDPDDEPLYWRAEDWRNVWHDSCGKSMDGEDWRYQFRQRICDFDVAVAMFPDRRWAIERSMQNSSNHYLDEFDESSIDPELAELEGMLVDRLGHTLRRDRVRLIACEYRMPERVKVLRGVDHGAKVELGALHGSVFDKANDGMKRLVEMGVASLFDAVKMVMYRMVFTGGSVLQWQRRRYNHNRFSLVPAWCYRKKRDGTPYGVPLQQIGPQNDVNKRFMKALWHISANQVQMEEGAWGEGDKEEFFDEIDKPDGKIITAPGKKVEFREFNAQLGQAHVAMASQSARYIESVGGVTDENRGIQTNAASGKAIQSRQTQGYVNTAELFDNSLAAFEAEGEIALSLIEQFMDEERQIMIGGPGANAEEFMWINRPDPETGEVMNDITAFQSVFRVDSTNYHATARQALFEQLGEIITRMPPEISVLLIDMWVNLSDVPDRQTIAARVRKATGVEDPNEDPNDPEVVARKEAEAKEAERQKWIQDKLVELEIQMAQAQIEKTDAEAQRNIAQARATIASIRQKMEEVKVKKATVLNQIEARRRAELAPPAPKLLGRQ